MVGEVTMFEQPILQPIRSLLEDPEVTEIMINGPHQVYVERGGRMAEVEIELGDRRQVQALVETLLEPTGRSISTASPYQDFRLSDGSRVNVIIPPVALDGPIVTIRKFTRTIETVDDLVQLNTLSQRMAQLLIAAVRGRLNIIFSGATGTGKTTALGVLSGHISDRERIITIEDTAELLLKQKHVIRLECRPPNSEGRGTITMGELVRNALWMRPTRIIVGEIRGEEALDMLQAILTGHEGCMAVVHGSSPADVMCRLEVMSLQRGLAIPLWAIHRQIASAIDLIVQHDFARDGTRKITRITEIVGVENDQIMLHDIFTYNSHGLDANGRAAGEWVCDGVRGDLVAKVERSGVEIPLGTLKMDK